MRKSKKEQERKGFCLNRFFYGIIDTNKPHPASVNKPIRTRSSELRRQLAQPRQRRPAADTAILTNPDPQSPAVKSQVRNEACQARLIRPDVTEDVSGLSAELVAASAKYTSAVP